jgi:outer membrane protein OmpA-like peptidoglycan-associated protein
MNCADWKICLANACVVALLGPFAVSEASAQTPAAETFEPQAVGETSLLSVATSQVSGHLVPSLQLVGHYADDPVELKRRGDPSTVVRLVDEQFKLDVGLGVGLFDRFELGLVLPVVVYQSGEATDFLPQPNAIDLAEARANVRWQILEANGFGLGTQGTVYLPTSSQAPYQSSGDVSALAALIADYRSGGAYAWSVAANVGWSFVPQSPEGFVRTDDRLDVRLGAEVEVLPDTLSVLAIGFGRWEVLAEATRSVSASYLGGARWRWGNTGLSTTLAAGGAAAGGYGTPDVRVVASLGYSPTTQNTSQAGVSGGACTSTDNQIGCADGDNDRDGIANGADSCPNEPEDFDGFDDTDGCPDADNDGDGTADFDDACPNEAGTPETAGCPFVDEDNDGIDASVDQCPDAAEDFDEFEDTDGCPDPDNDRDGIPDVNDACPQVPESINGVDDEDGCPDEGNSSVRLRDDRIEILEQVYFDTARASIKRRSHSVLEQVAAVLEANPDIRILRIQGHTDARGDERANLELSQQRAVSVKEFLIERGIDPRRLSARGYGESHPIADNESRKGRAENRRVEFQIIERGER